MSPRPPRKLKAHEIPIALSPEDIAFARAMVIFEDAEIIALSKPSGLTSQGGKIAVHTVDELLWAFAKPGKARPRLIHRLDRDTSGVLLAARTKPAAGFLGKAMMGRTVRKTYLAIVAGAPDPRQGRIETPLRREDVGRESYMRVCAADHPDAETALTRYRTLAAGPGAALVELRPETGRMHQLRVHLASIGRPIVGDVRYGGALVVEGRPVPRLMLHARALEFPHPAGGEKRIEAPEPADFAELAAALGLIETGTGGRARPFAEDEP